MPTVESTKPRRRKINVTKAQADIADLLPELEKLAARLIAISKQLEAREPDDKFVFGRPGRDHLRYRTASGAQYLASELKDLVQSGRLIAERTYADLLADWEEEQKIEDRRFPSSHEYFAMGG